MINFITDIFSSLTLNDILMTLAFVLITAGIALGLRKLDGNVRPVGYATKQTDCDNSRGYYYNSNSNSCVKVS